MRIPTARRAALSGAALVTILFLAAASRPSRLLAQPPARPSTPATPAAPAAAGRPAPQPEADPGVRPTRLIDRDEIRVSRIDLAPGAVRSVHAHDDVEYHVWTPVQGTFEFTMGNDKPVAAVPGQAFFMKKGTRHGFRNTGTTPGAVFEIFVKKSTTTANASPTAGADAVDAMLAALLPQTDRPSVMTGATPR